MKLYKLHWYDKKVYELIESGESFEDLSIRTDIATDELKATYRKVKQIIKL